MLTIFVCPRNHATGDAFKPRISAVELLGLHLACIAVNPTVNASSHLVGGAYVSAKAAEFNLAGEGRATA